MSRAFDSLRSILIWIVAFPVFIGSCLLIFCVALFYGGPRLEPIIKGCCRLILFTAGVRLDVRGAENIVPGRQYLLMMNHVNFVDPMVFYAGFPGRARGIEEESHFRWPVYGLMVRRIGQVPVNRKNPRKARESLKRAAELIRRRRDYSFLVLPEGTRTIDGKLGPFKRGGFILAVEAGLDILPLVQIGAYEINRKGSRLLRPGRIEFHIEPPIPSAGSTRIDHDALVERVRAAFLKYLEARPAGSSPPGRA